MPAADATGETAFDDVLDAARSGEGWAFTQLWVEYAPAVAAFLTARGAREPDDLTSEVFLAVFERIPQFSGDTVAFRSFVFSIAYRRLVDELRQRSRRGEHDEWTPEDDPRREPSAEALAERSLGDSAALRLLDELPDAQRDVMVLRVVADLSIEQTATVLGKRPGAVKALQHRAIANLQKKVPRTRNPRRGSNDSGE